MIRETLPGGGLRFTGTAGSFLYHRLKPSVLLTSGRGRDTGEFGSAPLDWVEREYTLFRRPVQWFFDASEAENPALSVSENWTAWLKNRQEILGHLHILTGSEQTRLTISVARHFSQSSRCVRIHSDQGPWSNAMLSAVPGLASPPDLSAAWSSAPVRITAQQSKAEGLVLEAPGCAWSFRLISPDVIFSRFTGDDSGALTDGALDEMSRLLGTSERKMSWFLDLRDARNVAAGVSQTWTEWLASQQARFGRITALAPSPLFPLVLTMACYRSGLENLFRIHREISPFREELVRVTSGQIARGVGVSSGG